MIQVLKGLLVILLQLQLCIAFRVSGSLNAVHLINHRITLPSRLCMAGVEADQVWNIEMDSSEIEAKSSADLKREKEEAERQRLARIEEEKRLEAERIRKEEEAKRSIFVRASSTETSDKSAPASVTSASAPVVVDEKSTATLSKGGFGAFDAGLLIAFPVIVATLMLFFLFPFLGPEFAKNLPPVPLD